ncbi:MAG: hypothetical protein AUF79_03085 [Crenarchaeota archaeon 13_1_20CM_2_51_8]|nr:MAG: hypothetical protein AUF79_03085 [Crenarchaeota archaeon 13_1_20CM_2_51_8]
MLRKNQSGTVKLCKIVLHSTNGESLRTIGTLVGRNKFIWGVCEKDTEKIDQACTMSWTYSADPLSNGSSRMLVSAVTSLAERNTSSRNTCQGTR